MILTDTSMQILDGYINFDRPFLKPQCDFVLVTKSGSQHSKLGNEMSKLVFDAIGKYIHPTHYRQIVETQSLDALNDKGHRVLCEDQKHSSVVAKVHYQKRRSREVDVKGLECLQKTAGCQRLRSGRGGERKIWQLKFQFANGHRLYTIRMCTAQKPFNRFLIQRRQRPPLRFTSDEDDFLRKGIEKHRFGQWTAILRDPDFLFQKGRLADSLKKRAELRLQLND